MQAGHRRRVVRPATPPERTSLRHPSHPAGTPADCAIGASARARSGWRGRGPRRISALGHGVPGRRRTTAGVRTTCSHRICWSADSRRRSGSGGPTFPASSASKGAAPGGGATSPWLSGRRPIDAANDARTTHARCIPDCAVAAWPTSCVAPSLRSGLPVYDRRPRATVRRSRDPRRHARLGPRSRNVAMARVCSILKRERVGRRRHGTRDEARDHPFDDNERFRPPVASRSAAHDDADGARATLHRRGEPSEKSEGVRQRPPAARRCVCRGRPGARSSAPTPRPRGRPVRDG